MLRTVTLALTIGLSVSAAHAACPSAVAGDTPGAVRANQQRLVCLQQQTLDASAQRQRDMELRMLENRIDQLQIQRRFDALPTVPPPIPPGF